MNHRKVVIIHYAEIALKGANRIYFEKQLLRNIKQAGGPDAALQIQRLRGRLVAFCSPHISDDDLKARLATVFGISHFSFGVELPLDVDTICQTAWALIENCSFNSFRVTTRRAQKEFPMTSMQVNQQVGAYLVERCGKKVDLKNPDLTLFIELTERNAFVYTQKEPGLRGLPVGVSERAVSLLSSGIDSPVASYMLLKRGVKLTYVHFHSQPFTSQASQELTEKLVGHLTRHQYDAKAYFIPFIDIQKEIMANGPQALRVLLYRRYMVRLATQVAWKEKAKALVTGESVAQVASQTLSNIRVVGEVTPLPVLRPLAGFDKDEIVARAKAIGTFEISTQPYEDCCSLFVPDNPATKSHPQALQQAEKHLEVDDLMACALAEAEVKTFQFSGGSDVQVETVHEA